MFGQRRSIFQIQRLNSNPLLNRFGEVFNKGGNSKFQIPNFKFQIPILNTQPQPNFPE
jgi:hypothetical protein